MNNDRFGRTPDEIDDEARHGYAVGTVALRAIADELSEIALKGDGISRWELKRLHDQLYDVYELLGSQTVFGMGNEPVADGSEGPLGLPGHLQRWHTRLDRGGAPEQQGLVGAEQ